MREIGIEAYLKHKVESVGGRCPKFTSPGNKGVPDRIAILPNGKVVFIELKTITGRLSEMQKYRIADLIKLQQDVRVFKTKKDIDQWISSLSIINKV